MYRILFWFDFLNYYFNNLLEIHGVKIKRKLINIKPIYERFLFFYSVKRHTSNGKSYLDNKYTFRI